MSERTASDMPRDTAPSVRPVAAAEPPRMQEVLDVAARLFDRKGFRATSLADIGEALGMNKASLYYYVRSKNELLQRLVFRASEGLGDLASAPGIARAAPPAVLELLVREHCRVLLDHPHEMGTLIRQRAEIDAEGLAPIAQREARFVQSVKRVIQRGMRDGSLRRMDATVATQLTLDSANSLLRWYKPDGRLSRDRVADEVWAYVSAALGVRAAPAKRPRKRAATGRRP